MGSTGDDPVSQQLPNWSEHEGQEETFITTHVGVDVPSQESSVTVGRYGPIVLADYNLIEQLAHFDREKIPDRVVHAKGTGAFGYFTCTKDLSHLTVASVFKRGAKTPIAVRFSGVLEMPGSPDTARDVRGFAIKFYTDEGNWDLVGNNTPIFFIRDPALFPLLAHSVKSNPATGLRDFNMTWDFFTLRPETLHQVMALFSDRGIPRSYRFMHGFGCHTFSFINEDRKLTWVKFTYKTNQGIQNMPDEEGMKVAGTDQDHANRDLYDAIGRGDFPSWTFYIQTMSTEEANELMSRKENPFNPFDITKVWPHNEFPFQEVGHFVLNRNPTNIFADVEQIAFSPNNFAPGIGPSPDRLLQGRLFSYQDTQRYRLGVNFEQLPVNKPYDAVKNYERDGFSTQDSQGGAPNYYPNSFNGPRVNPKAKNYTPPPMEWSGLIDYHDLKDEDNYSQPRALWNKVFNDEQKAALVKNLVSTIKLTTDEIQARAVQEFTKVDPELGKRLKFQLDEAKKKVVNL